ncbi:unnamed protein product [Paramecium sonneborni]|uniref:Transmembrane protein n=1 Tax=Paramecium sonneborni TaxID=65129 RepID=A0A8S1QT00_9CILI|nr:unnamed protein product [Paramecium sonneborni]
MNNGIRYISENRSQDLVYYFPNCTSRNPFHNNQSNNSDTLAQQDINSSVIKSTFIAKTLIVIGVLFGIILVILKMQGQNSMLQEYLFNVYTLKIQVTSFTFGFILLIVIIAIPIYQTQFKETQAHNIIGQILQTLFFISFIISAVTFTYFLFIYFNNGYYLVLSTILCLFLVNIALAIYVGCNKQQYNPKKQGICSIILIWIFSILSIFYFLNIWWQLLICGILIMTFELLVIHSVKFIIEEYEFKLTNQDYIISVPLIFFVTIISFLAIIFIIVIIIGLLCNSKSSESLIDDDS